MFSLRTRSMAAAVITSLLWIAPPASAADPVNVAVRPSVATEPASVLVIATVERHPDNRWLVIEAESKAFFRSSQRQLDGEYGARTHRLILKNLPAGNYTISVRVSGGDGVRAVSRCDLMVRGGAGGG